MKTIGYILFVVLRAIVRTILRFDRKVLKRYLNIETPLYKIWWVQYAAMMQKKLDVAYAKRTDEYASFTL